jgi:hypothetical protein
MRREGGKEVSGEDVFAKTPSPAPSPKTPIRLAASSAVVYGADLCVRPERQCIGAAEGPVERGIGTHGCAPAPFPLF